MDKAPEAFRIISEVAAELDVPQHVLRFWESRFPHVRPMKRGGGRRYYRPDDVDLLRGIRHMLYSEGYTIRGVQRILREQGVRFVQNVWKEGAPQPSRADNADAPSRGVFNLLPGFGKSVAADADDDSDVPSDVETGGALSEEQVQQLQDALQDLGECRRLIDAAFNETT